MNTDPGGKPIVMLTEEVTASGDFPASAVIFFPEFWRIRARLAFRECGLPATDDCPETTAPNGDSPHV
jgi:hypothetical protein